MAAHSSILAGEIPWTEEPGGLQSRGCKELDTTKRLNNNDKYIRSSDHIHLKGLALSSSRPFNDLRFSLCDRNYVHYFLSHYKI